MEVEVSWLGVILAAIASMVVGAIWYAKPVLGARWQKLAGLSDQQLKEGTVKNLTIAFILSLLTAYVLAHVTELSIYFFNNSAVSAALSTAFWLWLGISMTSIVVHAIFEQRKNDLIVMASAERLVTLLAMGLVIGLTR